MNEYRLIIRQNAEELAFSVRTANLLGDCAVGKVIPDLGIFIQVLRHVRDGYVTEDGQPCDGHGNILPQSTPEATPGDDKEPRKDNLDK